MGLDQGRQLVGPRGPAAAAEQPPTAVQVEQGGGPPHVERADGVQVALGVDVHVREPGPDGVLVTGGATDTVLGGG